MLRSFLAAAVIVLFAGSGAAAQTITYAPPGYAMPRSRPMVVMVPAQPRQQPDLGGGFIQFIFGRHGLPSMAAAPRPNLYQAPGPRRIYANAGPVAEPMPAQQAQRYSMDPRFLPRVVAYHGKEAPGTIVVDTPQHFLYLVEPGGMARRYGIGVGRQGFTWSGDYKITAKKQWPNWVPPEAMLQRQPYLPRFMAGGPDNPLGARALYIGDTLYRIHGSNAPWTIGHNISSGCIRMRNVDVIDLYKRVKVGTKVVVLPMHGPAVAGEGTSKTKPPNAG